MAKPERRRAPRRTDQVTLKPARPAALDTAVSAIAAATASVSGGVLHRYGPDNAFMRVSEGDGGVVRFELATRSYVRSRREPRLLLAAMSHVAQAPYYQSVASILDSCDLVLHESVTLIAEVRRCVAARARQAGLADQADELPYDDPRWRLADLSTDEQLDAFGQTLGVRITREALRRHWRRRLAETRREARIGGRRCEAGDTSARRRPPRLAARTVFDLSRVILDDRNRVAAAHIDRALHESEHSLIGVVYGAAHLFDLERYIRLTLGYRRAGVRWVEALSSAA